AAGRRRELTRHHAAVSPDGRFAGTDPSLALPRPAARDGGGADGVAGCGDRRRRTATSDRLGGAAGSSGRGAAKPEAAANPQSSGARRLRVEGEVKADAPLRNEIQDDSPRELPELRDFIRGRRAALAGFMEQGAGLAIDGDLLTVTPRNDIYVRYLNDNKTVIAELASEHLGRAIRVELSANGAARLGAGRTTMPLASHGLTRELPSSAAANTANQVAAAENGQRQTAPSKPVESIRESAPTSPAIETARRAATPEERQAVLADPAVRRVFDTLDARLVELKIPNAAEASAKESK